MPREKEWLPSLPLPKEQTVDGFRDWVRCDMWTWWNDRSSMTLNRKSETIRRLRRPEPRRLSAAATIALLREERAKGRLNERRSVQVADPFAMDVFVEFLTASHRRVDLASEDLTWLEGMLAELWRELEEHEEWPHYIIAPRTLRGTVINAMSHFDFSDETKWVEIGRSRHGHSGNYPTRHAFLNLARRVDTHVPDDGHMGEFLADILVGFLRESADDVDRSHRNTLQWFRDWKFTGFRLRPHMRRWFAEARKQLPDDFPVGRFDRLVCALHIDPVHT